MKLNVKFSLIVALTVFQISIFTGITISTSNRLQAMEHYRYIQAESQKELSELIVFLDEVDHWGTQTNTYKREWDEKVGDLRKNFDYLTTDRALTLLNKEVRENISQIRSLWDTFSQRLDPVETLLYDMSEVKLLISEYTSTQTDGIRVSYEKFPTNPKFKKLYDDLQKIHKQLDGLRRSYVTLNNISIKNTILLSKLSESRKTIFLLQTIIISLLSSIILVVLISHVTNNVAKRIIKVRDLTSVLAKKDFTTNINPEGSTEMVSLMNNINDMVHQINSFFMVVKTTASKAISSGYTINDSANSTAAASSEIDENINKINIQFEQISAAVKTAVQAIEDMNNQVDILVDNNSRQSLAIADSNNSVNEVVGTLDYISKMAHQRAESAAEMSTLIADGDNKISSTVDILGTITKQLDEVQEVVTIIDNVAEQTNLLSMNAAIESAHAGEAGKGFAVVAEEIRSLAEETSENASRIADVISKIVDYVKTADDTSSEAAQAFNKVSQHAGMVINSFQEITEGISQIDSQMLQIKDKSEETSVAADQINKYCGNLSDRQRIVSNEVSNMNTMFDQAAISLRQIKSGTADIVNRMKDVSFASKESYKNMSDLENVLEEFKTNQEVSDEVAKIDEENAISKVVSHELATEDIEELHDIGEEVKLDHFLN